MKTASLRPYILLAAALPAFFCSCSGSARDHRTAATKANRSLALGDTAAAIRHIERVNLKKTRDPQLYALLGSLYRDIGTISSRLQSQRLLESGLQQFPGDPDLLTELGKTYFSQTFYPDAVRAFSQALEADPGRCEAHHYIGLYYFNNWRRLSQYQDDLLAARRHFQAAVHCDSTDRGSSIRLALALFALERLDAALEFSDIAIRRFPDEPVFYMMRGAIAYRDDRFADARSEFRRGVERMDDDLNREYVDLFEMLPHSERFAYAEAVESKRTVRERAFWIDRDPDPTTAINERHLEHLYRMFIAELYFSCYRPPIRGWRTERGAAVVKFGWPWTIERTLGDSWDSGRIEKWYYIQHGKLREFVFEDEYLSGNLRIPLYADSMVVVLRYDPRSSTYRTETVSLPGAMDVVAFKDDQFSSTVYMAVKVDADSLQRVVDLRRVNHFYLRGAFFDGEWVADHRFADTLWTSDVSLAREGRARFYHLVRSVSLPFDAYHVACVFEDEDGAARALFKNTGNSYRYVHEGLEISDILFQSPPESRAVWFERSGKTLYPNPGRRYKTGSRLAVYFEIYGLGLSRRRSDYDVTFQIYEAPQKTQSRWAELGRRIVELAGFGGESDPAVSQTFRRRGADYTAIEEIAIDIDALDGGRYELIISVFDRVTEETAHVSGVFFKESD